MRRLRPQTTISVVQCRRPGKLLPLVDLLYRLSLLPSPFLAQALQRLQGEVIQVMSAL